MLNDDWGAVMGGSNKTGWLSLGLCLVVLAAPAWAKQSDVKKPDRDIVARPKVEAGSVPIVGDYWALIIGIDQYQHDVPKLDTAVWDAKAVRDVLVGRYGFIKHRIVTLFNGQATREAIEDAFYSLGQKAGPNDSVFIYYAGHGQTDSGKVRGWWVPVDGKAKSPGTFISNARIRDEIAAMKAKHVYLVADSCFSGTLFGKGRDLPPIDDRFYSTLYANKSRWGLTSGMNEPVTDAGKDGHSIFAYFFLKFLNESQEPYLAPSDIYKAIARVISNNAEQQPVSQPLKNAGDEDGQFVFRLTSASGGPLPPSVRNGRIGSSGEVARLRQELEALMDQMNKSKPEPPKPIEEARARPYETPQQMGRELISKDGAPMLLVPEGEFLYGVDNQQLSLSAFYMDKYEVSTAHYATFMGATGTKELEHWEPSVPVSNGQKPVVGVSWHEADAYCGQYGKRLPTEQEWEKAARGTDGRKYPWGNEEPTSKHAKYNQDGKASWNGYATLASVESYEAGKSPYGIYNMAGNVWEWTSSDYESSWKVLRGGSWLDRARNLRTTDRERGTPAVGVSDRGFRCAQDAR